MIETMIDVVIISEPLIETTNKKTLFENIRNVEPNIRIIILFPGYRNQYIEEQIKEYKEIHGISDILYEGSRIDDVYFAEIIKKGFVYDEQVNAYDEQEDIPTVTAKQECVKIGVLGLTHGCGVTNMALAVSTYIALSRDLSVKVIDCTNTGNLRFVKRKKITCLVHSGIDIERIFKTSEAVVFDFGAPFQITPKGKLVSKDKQFTEKYENYFKSCDLKICMCFSDPWHAGKIKYLLHEKDWKKEIDNSWLFLFDALPGKVKTRFSRSIYTRNDKVIENCIDELLKGGG